MTKSIIFTGGGSAGHVTPNLALIAELQQRGWKVHYIGSSGGIEQKIVSEAGIPYYPIASGKLRRYVSLQNIKDPFKVIKGCLDAYRIIHSIKPKVIFSKGGFVSVPVVAAGWLSHIPVIIHESDLTPGLANKLSAPFARHVCVTFPETARFFPNEKVSVTGLPVREEITRGDAARGRLLCGFAGSKKVILVMGGSLGSKKINEVIRSSLPALQKDFCVVHLCGKGNLDPHCNDVQGYRQFEYVSKELPDLTAAADLVISRAGSTSLFEFLHLRKPMVLIPLPRSSSRGDQILNARTFVSHGLAKMIEEEDLTSQALMEALEDLTDNRGRYLGAMQRFAAVNGKAEIIQLIEKYL